jgi:hypothetical protein
LPVGGEENTPMKTQRTNAALAALALGFLLAGDALAQNAALPGIRPLGMGNAFVAVGDDRNALYYNPAALSKLEKTRVSGLGVLGGIDNEFFNVIEFIQDNEEQFSDFDTIDQEFYDSLAPYDDKWVAADANAYMDFTRPGFGIGAYTTGRIQFKVDRGVYEPRVHASVSDDIVAVAGGSMDLGHYGLTAGAALKGIWRRQTERALTAREVVDFDPQDILDDLASAEAGFGMDLGLMWSPPLPSLTVGAVLRDAPGFIGGESLGAAFDLGAAWRPFEEGLLSRMVVALDLKDAFDGGAAFGNKLHLGTELALPIVSVRGGFNQGYPTAGVSLGTRILSLDYAFFGRELGEFPGAESQFLHALEARLGF